MELNIEFDREDDGRWIADIPELPGTIAYGSTREEAVAAVQALAFRVLAEKVEHGEIGRELLDISFGVAA